MRLTSTPIYPADRARLGDFAIRQNKADRTQALLNTVLDERFQPIHSVWKTLWQSQHHAEQGMDKTKEARDEARRELLRAHREAQTAISAASQPEEPRVPISTEEISQNDTLLNRASMEKSERLLERIGSASNDVVPVLRDRLAGCIERARATQSAFEHARNAAHTARDERAAADSTWDQAYKVLHISVEFITRGEPRLISKWILPWPPGANVESLDACHS